MRGLTLPGAVLTVALLSVMPGANAGMYTKKSPVLSLDAKDYDRLIAKSNYTTILEFYAPWCGHCQNLKPAYEKAAKNLEGMAKVAAMNCDDDVNKPFCGSMDVKGFPTLKIITPSKKKGGKPIVEPYNGPREAPAIVSAVVERINNHVQKVTDKNIDEFLSKNNESAKAILFSEKGTTSALLKSIAIDFLDVITISQVRDKETDAVEMFGIEKYPTLVLLPGGEKESIVFDGELKKETMVEWLSQAGSPNPDPAPLPVKEKSKASSKAKTATEEPAAESAEDSEQKPIIIDIPASTPGAPPIPVLGKYEELIQNCLTDKSHTCVLAFVPKDLGEKADEAVTTLSNLAHKYAQANRHLFPFYQISKADPGAVGLLGALKLRGDVEIVAINARRRWWKPFEGTDFGTRSVESWIDAIRMGEGEKKKLPDGLIAISVDGTSDETKAEATPEATPEAAAPEASESSSSTEEPPVKVTPEAEASEAVSSAAEEPTPTQAADPVPEPETAKAEETPVKHEEL